MAVIECTRKRTRAAAEARGHRAPAQPPQRIGSAGQARTARAATRQLRRAPNCGSSCWQLTKYLWCCASAALAGGIIDRRDVPRTVVWGNGMVRARSGVTIRPPPTCGSAGMYEKGLRQRRGGRGEGWREAPITSLVQRCAGMVTCSGLTQAINRSPVKWLLTFCKCTVTFPHTVLNPCNH